MSKITYCSSRWNCGRTRSKLIDSTQRSSVSFCIKPVEIVERYVDNFSVLYELLSSFGVANRFWHEMVPFTGNRLLFNSTLFLCYNNCYLAKSVVHPFLSVFTCWISLQKLISRFNWSWNSIQYKPTAVIQEDKNILVFFFNNQGCKFGYLLSRLSKNF